MSGYDSHLIFHAYASYVQQQSNQINVIPKSMEKYLAFSFLGYQFLDSNSFLQGSLERKVEFVVKGDKELGQNSFVMLKSWFGGNTEYLKRKGIYPYSYMDSFARF